MKYDNEFEKYHNYLLKRSIQGLLYRKFFLYPKINRYVKGRVLDVGCGIGDFLGYHSGSTGVDINPNNVDYCVKNGHRAVLYDGENLPFNDGDFDFIILDNVLEHILEPGLLMKEIERVSAVGSVLVIGVPGEKGFASDDDHKIFYDEKMLIDCIEGFGFRAMSCRHMPFKSLYLNKKFRQYCVYGFFEKLKDQ